MVEIECPGCGALILINAETGEYEAHRSKDKDHASEKKDDSDSGKDVKTDKEKENVDEDHEKGEKRGFGLFEFD